MRSNYIDNLFLNLGKVAYAIKVKGLKYTNFEKLNLKYYRDDIVYRYLKNALDLSEKGYNKERLECELSFELSKICGNINIDDVTLKCLHIIKSLIKPIIDGDYEFILGFSKYYCSKKIYNELNEVFALYIRAI